MKILSLLSPILSFVIIFLKYNHLLTTTLALITLLIIFIFNLIVISKSKPKWIIMLIFTMIINIFFIFYIVFILTIDKALTFI